MKINAAGPSSQQRSLPFNSERTVNLYAIADQSGKSQAMLQGTPGYELFSKGTVEGRDLFVAAGSGRCFCVEGFNFFEVMSDGTRTFWGALLTAGGIVKMIENGVQIMIMDGTYGYIFTYATNVFIQILDADFPFPCGYGDFNGGYFMVPQSGTGKFYISDLYNGLSWQPLNFATAESTPDNLQSIITVQGQSWLGGTGSFEVWTNTGSSRFPFELISGAVIDVGLAGAACAQAIDNTILFIGQNEDGGLIVYRATGFTPQRISTEPIELLLGKVADRSTLRTWKYQQEGHVFFVITGGGMETTLVYDLTTQLWHERAYLNAQGFYETHRGIACCFAFGKTLIIDRVNGNIYRMALDIYSDNGDALASDRIFTHISDENTYTNYGRLTVDLETGVGTQTGQGFNPQIMLSMSNDGGRTYGINQMKSFGRVGQYLSRVIFSRLGIARVRTFRVRITDPVKRSILALYLNV